MDPWLQGATLGCKLKTRQTSRQTNIQTNIEFKNWGPSGLRHAWNSGLSGLKLFSTNWPFVYYM